MVVVINISEKWQECIRYLPVFIPSGTEILTESLNTPQINKELGLLSSQVWSHVPKESARCENLKFPNENRFIRAMQLVKIHGDV
jgi:hypothetical protein